MLRPRDAALMGLASQLEGKDRERIVARMSRSARRDFLATNTIKMLADWKAKAKAKQHNTERSEPAQTIYEKYQDETAGFAAAPQTPDNNQRETRQRSQQ